MSGLETRARWLLRCYPPSYRECRGDEMLGTLLDTSPPGRSWPVRRDAWSLITGGLSVRSRQNRGLSLRTNVRLALILGTVLSLAFAPSTLMSFVPFWPGAAYEAIALLLVATIVAPWFAHRGVSVALALLSAVALGGLAYHASGHDAVWVAQYTVPPLALAVAVAVGPVRPPRCWLWLPAVAAVAAALFYSQNMPAVVFSPLRSEVAGLAATVILFGLLTVIVAWLVVDARPALALVIALVVVVDPDVVFAAAFGGASTTQYLAAVAPLAVGGVGALRLRRAAVSVA
jgi:hypothetical protein